MRRFWRVANPRVMSLARHTSMVGVLETVGRRSGVVRRTPLAIGVDARTAARRIGESVSIGTNNTGMASRSIHDTSRRGKSHD